MARKKKHNEHTNHEAWAIPYADLMTLLLAFFVVMYAISSLNESKYKIVADALNSAFGGPPRTLKPVQFGERMQTPPTLPPAPIQTGVPGTGTDMATTASHLRSSQMSLQPAVLEHTQQQLHQVADELERALADLIRERLIVVRRSELWLEVEINSDILFTTGSAILETDARGILTKVANVLADAPNQIRIEGYTDNRPIHTAQFPSNWELSAARAASVVHLFSERKLAAERLSMVGFGEYRPLADNTTAEGRTRNRRVILVVLAAADAEQQSRLLARRAAERERARDTDAPESVPHSARPPHSGTRPRALPPAPTFGNAP